jgi:hypothetical protein
MTCPSKTTNQHMKIVTDFVSHSLSRLARY